MTLSAEGNVFRKSKLKHVNDRPKTVHSLAEHQDGWKGGAVASSLQNQYGYGCFFSMQPP